LAPSRSRARICPAPSSNDAGRLSDTGQFQPLVFAEKALGALLNGVLLYALGCIVGVALVSLNFEGVLGERVNWWLVFLPFWLANVAMLYAHAASIRHAKTLRRWADVESMSNEPLLPLLRRIVLVYAISFPLTVLLLWSELAFCASLQNTSAASLYICYAPLMVIQVAFVVRYLLCRSDSTLPVNAMLLWSSSRCSADPLCGNACSRASAGCSCSSSRCCWPTRPTRSGGSRRPR